MRTKKLGLSRLDGGAPEGPLRWLQRPHSSRMMAFVSGQRLLTPPPVALSFSQEGVCNRVEGPLGFELRPVSTLDYQSDSSSRWAVAVSFLMIMSSPSICLCGPSLV